MKFLKTITPILAAAIMAGCNSEQSQPQENPFSLNPVGIGWNMGNQLDCFGKGGDETSWGNKYASKSLIDSVRSIGFQTIRIPITWKDHFGPYPEHTIDTAFFARVDEIVGWCEQDSMRVIINVHHDGADSKYWLNIKNASLRESANDSIKTELKNVWHQIAEHFKDKGYFLMFETMNEIHDGGWGWGGNRNDNGKQYGILNSWNQLVVDEIRSTGSNNSARWIGVPGYVTNPDLTLEHFVMPKDSANRTMLAVHYYSPFDYALEDKYSEWGKDADTTKSANKDNEADMDTLFSKLEQKFVNANIPVYIGEFGCVRRNNERAEKFRLYYLETLCKTAKKHRLSCIYWDNGYLETGREQSGLFDRSTGEFMNDGKEVAKTMVEAYKD